MGDIIADLRGMAEWFSLRSGEREVWEDAATEMNRHTTCLRAANELQRLSAEVERLKAELACENGHLDHAGCDEQCACVGSGKSRLERAEAEVERLSAENERRLEELNQAQGRAWMGADELQREVERLKAEIERLVNVAGDALGTDPSLRSTACIDALAAYVKTVRADIVKAQREAWERGFALGCTLSYSRCGERWTADECNALNAAGLPRRDALYPEPHHA